MASWAPSGNRPDQSAGRAPFAHRANEALRGEPVRAQRRRISTPASIPMHDLPWGSDSRKKMTSPRGICSWPCMTILPGNPTRTGIPHGCVYIPRKPLERGFVFRESRPKRPHRVGGHEPRADHRRSELIDGQRHFSNWRRLDWCNLSPSRKSLRIRNPHQKECRLWFAPARSS